MTVHDFLVIQLKMSMQTFCAGMMQKEETCTFTLITSN